MGGVWDDSDMSQSAIGGTCLDSWQASKRLRDGKGAIEEVVVALNHDRFLKGPVAACHEPPPAPPPPPHIHTHFQ